jgi:hypothetical protein
MEYDYFMSSDSSLTRRRERQIQGTSRLVSMEEEDGSFDREFWRKIDPAKRLEMVWDMVLEYQSWKNDEHQSRLQRSVCRIERS